MKTRIALVGIPGSGKSEMAEAISDFLIKNDGSCKECYTPVGIVDDYAQEASRFLDIAKGFSGSSYLDLYICLSRMGLERQKAFEGCKTVITCGSIIESTAYSMMNFENRREFIVEENVSDEIKRIQAAMMTMACLYMDSFAYDRVYYLNPIRPAEEDQNLFKELDKLVQSFCQAFDLWSTSKVLSVEATTIEEATKQRLEIIKGDFLESSDKREDVQPEGVDGRGVPGGEEEENQRDSSGPMSDL